MTNSEALSVNFVFGTEGTFRYACQCPLIGYDQKCRGPAVTAEFDPKATSGLLDQGLPWVSLAAGLVGSHAVHAAAGRAAEDRPSATETTVGGSCGMKVSVCR
jgi:hypothetical protein